MVISQLMAAALASSCFIAFGVGMRRFFIRPDGVQPWMRLIQRIGPPLAAVHVTAVLFTPPTGSWNQFVATSLFAAALGLFLWTWHTAQRIVLLPLAFSMIPPPVLLESGPYAYVRHPFYLSYVTTWFAGSLYCWSLALLMTALLFLAIYVRAIHHEEAVILNSALASSYLRYRSRAGMFTPRVLDVRLKARLVVTLSLAAFSIVGALVLIVTNTPQLLVRSTRVTPWRRLALSVNTAFNQWACRWGIRRLNVHVVPLEALNVASPVMLVANHVSWLDVFVLGSLGRFVFVAKREFESGLVGLILRSFGTVFLQDHTATGLEQCNDLIRRTLALGRSVVVFPEARTGTGEALNAFHPALFQAALEAGVNTVPVALRYSSMNEGGQLSVAWVDNITLSAHIRQFIAGETPRRATVAVGTPIEPWFRTRRELADQARQVCQQLLRLDEDSLDMPCNAPDLIGQGDALPEWFTRRLVEMHEAGVLPDPPDVRWRRRTRLSATSIDSLSMVCMWHEFGSSLFTSSECTGELTFDDLLNTFQGPADGHGSAGVPLTVRPLASTEIRQAGELRYQVYVQEMRRPFPTADPKAPVLNDPLDLSGLVLGAFRGRDLVGTCRINFGSDPLAWRTFGRQLSLQVFEQSRDSVAIISRLAISVSDRKNGALLSRLLAAVVSAASSRGATTLVAHTRAALTASFGRIGFERHADPYFDTEWGSWQLPIVAPVSTVLLRTPTGEFSQTADIATTRAFVGNPSVSPIACTTR